MDYKFPEIRHLDDVLDAIKDNSEFILADKGDYKVVNYVVDTGETFSREHEGWEIRRECRGLIFDKSGYISSRPFHKFANFGQWPETQVSNIDFSKVQFLMNKADGSFIRPFIVDGLMSYGTKMGVTETALQAQEVIDRKFKRYNDFSLECLANRITPIFEFTSPKNRIVLDYAEEGMWLLGMRHMITGNYIDIYHNDLVDKFDIDLVERFDFPQYSQESLLRMAKEKGIEGYVWEFPGGHRVKAKTEEYVNLHRVFDAMTKERHIVVAIIDGILDDFIPSLTGDKLAFVEEVQRDFEERFSNTVKRVTEVIRVMHGECGGDRKRFALEVAPKLEIKSDAKYAFDSLKDDFSLTEAIFKSCKSAAARDVTWEAAKEWLK